jgi:hypothetical protein
VGVALGAARVAAVHPTDEVVDTVGRPSVPA